MKAEEQGDTDRHVGIPGEVEVNLDRVCDGGGPRDGGGNGDARCGGVKGAHRKTRGLVGDDHFFRQADGENRRSDGECRPAQAQPALVFQLRQELAVMHNRACDQMRKKDDKERVVEQPRARLFRVINLREIFDLLECVERNRQGEREADDMEMHAREAVQRLGKKARVFAPSKQREVSDDAEDVLGFSDVASALRFDAFAEAEVDDDRAREEERVERIPPAVEEDRDGEEPVDAGAAMDFLQREKSAERDREEGEHEGVGAENHCGGMKVSVMRFEGRLTLYTCENRESEV